MDTEKFLIKSFEVRKLWGYRDINLHFDEYINIIIGPNASGKTTILNLLGFILAVDIANLHEIEFFEAVIRMEGFDSQRTRTLRVRPGDEFYRFTLSNRDFKIPTEPYLRASRRASAQTLAATKELVEAIDNIIQLAWLPVNRRLPIASEDSFLGSFSATYAVRDSELMRNRRGLALESVDARLDELLTELPLYRLRLDAQLSELYKHFQKSVLQMILYSEEHDRLDAVTEHPTQQQKDQLVAAFDAAGLMDRDMQERIDAHFVQAHEALHRLASWRPTPQEDAEKSLPDMISALLIMPLIRRTKAVADFAERLEHDRMLLFDALTQYEHTVNSFLASTGKRVEVDDDGDLQIESLSGERDYTPRMLSSGEKQLLILLTQALLWEDRPVVYMADEPELSLHVTWQEKLLESLMVLGGQLQIIVATHSPDIVGPYQDFIIDLAELEDGL